MEAKGLKTELDDVMAEAGELAIYYHAVTNQDTKITIELLT